MATTTTATGKLLSGRLCMALLIMASVALFIAPDAMAAPKQSTTETKAVAAQSDNPKLAKIGDHLVTQDELSSFSMLIEFAKAGPMAESGDALSDYALAMLIDDVYTTIPAQIKSDTSVPSKYRFASQRGHLFRAMREKTLKSIDVSRGEMEEWFSNNSGRYQEPERIKARHLFMQTSKDNPSSSPERVRERMLKVKRAVDKNTTFGELAMKYSEAGSGAKGGEIGWVSYRMPIGPQNKPMNIVLDDALFKLEPGQASDILETSYGLHIVFAEQRNTTRTPTLDDLITSRILPSAAANERLTSRIMSLISDTKKKHNAKVLVTSPTAELTTDTKAFEIDGNVFTAHALELIYGPRFTSAFMRSRTSPERAMKLLEDVLDTEAYLAAAIDAGADATPDMARDLNLLGRIEKMRTRFNDIVAQAYQTNDEQARELYEKMKDRLRRPEASGYIITIQPESATGTGAQMKAMEEARVKAEETARKLRDGAGAEKIARELSKDNRASSGGLVERHVIGTMNDEAGRNFDGMAMQLQKKGDVSDPRQLPNGFAIAVLDERWAGEPTPFEDAKPRLIRQAATQNENRARADMMSMLEASGKIEWLDGATKYGKTPSK
ncbi:MAG: peptidylprolyl isomerase [bacterium]